MSTFSNPEPAAHTSIFTRAKLLAHLEALGFKTVTIDHPPVHTVAESGSIELSLPGAHTKNLFLKDEDGRLLLVVAKTSTKADLKKVAKLAGMKRLSFGKPELLFEVLGVTPGSVTAFALINDTARRVRVVLDEELMAHDTVNCHPLENVATTNIATQDLLSFIRGMGHDPAILRISAD